MPHSSEILYNKPISMQTTSNSKNSDRIIYDYNSAIVLLNSLYKFIYYV